LQKFVNFEKTYNKNLKQDSEKELNPCTDKATCRTMRQINFIAFCRMNKFNKTFETGSNAQSYLLEIAGDFSQKGVSRYSFQTTYHEDKDNNLLRNDTPVFKICVPTDVSEQGWIAYLCPYTACARNFEVSQRKDKCKIDQNVLNGTLQIKQIRSEQGKNS